MPLPQLVSRSVFFRTVFITILLGASIPGAYASRTQLSCNPRSISFGKVVVGRTQTQPVSVVNTGSTEVTILAVNVSNAAFTVTFPGVLTLSPGQSVQFSVAFSPLTAGNASGNAVFESSAGTLNFSVSGRGVSDWQLTATPPSLSFGNVQVGSFLTLPLTINNPSTSSQTVEIGKVGGAGFSVSGVKLPLTLGAGQSFTFNVTFAPTAAGSASGSILATSPNSPTLTIPLSGMGTAATGFLTLSPLSINFGNVTIGQSATQNGQLTASNSNVTISSATMSNQAFQLNGLLLPVTLQTGQSVNFTVIFTPQTSGAASGTLTFTSDASNSPTVQSLAGTGTAVQYSVNLTWDPSVSPQIVGYNVYRSNQSGGPYSRINPALDPDTAYTDGTVVGGQTYYYATTAVDSQGQESGYSNLSEAVIP